MSFDYVGFFEESNDELIKYIENIDNLFFNKIGQLYYNKARTIIKKDLHNLVEANNVCIFNFMKATNDTQFIIIIIGYFL